MAEDIIKPKGQLKRSTPERGGANPRVAPVLGVVKDNVDPTRTGRIMVYISDNSGTDPDNKDNWRPVRFLSPFFGFTRPDAGNSNLGTYVTNPSSYGMWMAPPDIGTTVVCLFIDGDMNYGFYIGCVPEPEAMQMLPAIGATENIVPNSGEAQSYGGAKRLPVTNINSNNKNIADSPDYLFAPKPVHSYSSAIMFQQGVLRDPIRGPISTSSQRETPSRVGWGVSTPGRPIYEGGFDDQTVADNLKEDQAKQLRVVSRRGGHSIVMDDGDVIGRDDLIRIRSARGHQILMSDDGQTLMLLHSNGQSYIELGKEGTVDIFSTNSINLRTQGDLNLHADNDVNIHAGKKLNLQAEEIHENTETTYKLRVGTDYTCSTGGIHTSKVSGAFSVASGGQASMASGAEAFVNGSKVNLNSGKTGTTPAEVQAIEKTLHTDTLFDQQKGWLAAPAKLVSITSRAPAHAPWTNAGQGVDVKNNPNASANLPSSPSAGVSQTNAAAASAGVSNPVTQAATSSAPSSQQISPSLDKNATKGITGAVATSAAAGPLAAATKKGAAIADVPGNSLEVGVGQFALTPRQLEQSGVLKPGSAALVTSIAATTGNVQAAFSPSMFTGKPGAQNFAALVGNVQAQTDSLVKNLSAAQTQLQNAGAITGKESAGSIGGLVMSAGMNGAAPTIDAIKATATQASGQLSSLTGNFKGLTGQADSVLQDIAGGNFAAKLGESAGGALSGLESSLQAAVKSPSMASVIDQAKGASAAAFDAIKGSLPALKAGVPQNLSKIASDIAAETESAAASSISNAGAQFEQAAASAKSKLEANIPEGLNASDMASGLVSKATGGLTKGLSVADSLIGTAKSTAQSKLQSTVSKIAGPEIAGSVTASVFGSAGTLISKSSTSFDSLQKAAQTVASGITSSTAGAVASGLSNLPGGQAATSSITNLAAGVSPSLPGTEALKASLQSSATNALNNTVNNISSQVAGIAGQIGDAAGQLGGALDKALGKASDLKGKLDGLKAKATAGLPAGAAASLESAMSSIAAAGSGVKVPSIGINTTDRSSLKAAVASQFDDKRIPVPNLGDEIDQAVASKLDGLKKEAEDFAAQSKKLLQEQKELSDKLDSLANEQLLAIEKLPAGDPAIEEAKRKYTAAAKEFAAKSKEVDLIIKNSVVQVQSTTSAVTKGIGGLG